MQQLSASQAGKIIDQVDQRFEKNRSHRLSIESEWVDIIEAAVSGNQLKERISEVVGFYSNTGDPAYSMAWHHQHVKGTAWIDNDFLRIEPSASTYLPDYELVKATEELVKQKLRHKKSCFAPAVRMFDQQLRLINVSALSYEYCITNKRRRRKSYDQQSGQLMYRSEPDELEYQGGKFRCLNMFNCYPDAFDPSTDDLNERDVFIREGISLAKLKSLGIYSPKSPYLDQQLVLYRDNQRLLAIEDANYEQSTAETRLGSVLHESSTGGYRGYCEVRKCWLKEAKVDDQCLENIIVHYAKVGGDCVPLLVKYNPYDFNDKPIKFAEQVRSPYKVYGRSLLGLSYNASCEKAFYTAAQAYLVGKECFPTVFYPGQLKRAVLDLGYSEHDFDKALTEPGRRIAYDASKYDAGPAAIWSPNDARSERQINFAQLAIGKSEGDLQTTQATLQTPQVGDSTATGVKYVAGREDLVQRYEQRVVFDHVVTPLINMMLEDLSQLLHEEHVMAELTEQELADMLGEAPPGGYGSEPVQLIKGQSVEGGSMPISITLNPATMKKYYALDASKVIRGQAQIQYEGTDFDKMQDIEKHVQLYSHILQMSPDPQVALKVLQAAVMQINDLSDNPIKDEINKILKQAVDQAEQQAQQPDPTDQAKAAESEAKAREADARTENLIATAEEKQLNNIQAGQQVQAEQELIAAAQAGLL